LTEEISSTCVHRGFAVLYTIWRSGTKPQSPLNRVHEITSLILQGWLIHCTLFGLLNLLLSMSLSTDPRTLVSKRRIEDFHRAQIVKFVSFTGAFTSKCVVKSVKEACKTVHSIPKETCQNATQFDRPCKTACFWWVKETPKNAQECGLGLCNFVGYFHVFPSVRKWRQEVTV